MLTFDEAKHEYAWNGVYVPNVTRVLSGLTDYSFIKPDVLKLAQEKGKAVHKMVELDCAGDLDVDQLPEWMRGHFKAWLDFRADTGFTPWGSEHQFYSNAFGYAGTLDLVGVMPKASTRQYGVLIDVKRSFFAGPAIGLQTAAYLDAWNRLNKDRKARHRFALRLDEDGKYRLEPFEDTTDFAVFLALLTAHKWKAKHYGRN